MGFADRFAKHKDKDKYDHAAAKAMEKSTLSSKVKNQTKNRFLNLKDGHYDEGFPSSGNCASGNVTDNEVGNYTNVQTYKNTDRYGSTHAGDTSNTSGMGLSKKNYKGQRREGDEFEDVNYMANSMGNIRGNSESNSKDNFKGNPKINFTSSGDVKANQANSEKINKRAGLSGAIVGSEMTRGADDSGMVKSRDSRYSMEGAEFESQRSYYTSSGSSTKNHRDYKENYGTQSVQEVAGQTEIPREFTSFSTGIARLDRKISSLPSDARERARQAFERGYQDGMKLHK